MDVASWLAVGAVVLAQCAAYFLGLLRGRTDPTSRRRGYACIVFATYVGWHALRLASVDAVSERLGRAGTAATLVAIGPAFLALSESFRRSSVLFRRGAFGYALVGFLGAAAFGFGIRIPGLDRVFQLPSPFVPRSGHELVAMGYFGVGAFGGAYVIGRVLLGERVRSRPRTTTVFMTLAFFLGLRDFYLRLTASGELDIGFDIGLVAVALACLDETIRATTQAGDSLQTKTAELQKSYADLRATQARLVRNEQLAAVGELSAVIAHEVRNPLAIIKNALSGLRRKSLRSSDRVTLLDILDEETDKLNRLMHDLLAYARPVAPRLANVDLDDVLRRAVERAFGGVMAPMGLEVRIESIPLGRPLLGDPELLVHAFVNVIENALQAMPQGGCLSLRAREAYDGSRDCVAVDIGDTGEGMDTIVRSKARDPFFTTRPTGTGLGLAIVERVVRNHGGRIEIESRHGEGTTVSILLPLDRQSLQPLPVPESSTEELVLPRGLGR